MQHNKQFYVQCHVKVRYSCNFCRKCKLAATSLRFKMRCNFPQITAKLLQVSNMFETGSISR